MLRPKSGRCKGLRDGYCTEEEVTFEIRSAHTGGILIRWTRSPGLSVYMPQLGALEHQKNRILFLLAPPFRGLPEGGVETSEKPIHKTATPSQEQLLPDALEVKGR